MKTTCLHSTQVSIPTTSEEWTSLSKTLLAYIKNYLYTLSVVHWHGNEVDLAEDVLQETYVRALQFAHRDVAHESKLLINNFEAFCKTVAQRYILDLRRKDRRLVASIDDDHFTITYVSALLSDDPIELAIEHMNLYSSMLTFSQIVKSFPKTQRTAILVDLARKTDFDDECPSPLESAMKFVGIPLRLYDRALPSDPVLRSRYNASLSIAYKRLRLAFQNTVPQLHPAA